MYCDSSDSDIEDLVANFSQSSQEMRFSFATDSSEQSSESLFDIGQKNFESVWRKSATVTYPCAYGVQSEPEQNSFLMLASVEERISAVMEGLP